MLLALALGFKFVVRWSLVSRYLAGAASSGSGAGLSFFWRRAGTSPLRRLAAGLSFFRRCGRSFGRLFVQAAAWCGPWLLFFWFPSAVGSLVARSGGGRLLRLLARAFFFVCRSFARLLVRSFARAGDVIGAGLGFFSSCGFFLFRQSLVDRW